MLKRNKDVGISVDCSDFYLVHGSTRAAETLAVPLLQVSVEVDDEKISVV